MYAKYEVSISYGSKVIAKVKVDNRQTDKHTDKQTGQKQYAPDHSIRGGGGGGGNKNISSMAYIDINCWIFSIIRFRNNLPFDRRNNNYESGKY